MRKAARFIFLFGCIGIALFFAIFLVRSLNTEDLFIARTRLGMFAMGTYRGGMQLYVDALKYQPSSAVVVWADGPARPLPAPKHHSWYHPFGFAVSNTSIDSRLHEYLRSPGVLGPRLEQRRTVCLPFWALMLLFWTPPLVWLTRKVRAQKRVRDGKCPVCGYQIKEEMDLCPGCGRECDLDFLPPLDEPGQLSPIPSTWGQAKD